MVANNSPSSFSNSPPLPSSLAHFFSGVRLAPKPGSAPTPTGKRGPTNAELAASPTAFPRSYDDHIAEVGQALGGKTLGHIHAGLQAAFIGRPVNRAVGDSAEAEQMNATYLGETARELGGDEEKFLREIGIPFDTSGNIDRQALASGLTGFVSSESERERAWLEHWTDEEGKYFEGLGKYRLAGVGPGTFAEIMRQEKNLRFEQLMEAAGGSSSRFRGLSFDEKGRNYRFLAAGYIPYRMEATLSELGAKEAAGTATTNDIERLNFLKQKRQEYSDDNEKDDWGQRTGTVSRIQKHLDFKYSEKGKLLKRFNKAQKIYKKASNELKDFQDAPVWYVMKAPFRIAWHYVKKKIWRELKKKIVKEIAKRAEQWFGEAGKTAFREGAHLLENGLGGIVRNGAIRGGEAIGRYGGRVAKQLGSALARAGRAALQAVWGAIRAAAQAIFEMLVAAATQLVAAAGVALEFVALPEEAVALIILIVVIVIVLFIAAIVIILQQASQNLSNASGSCFISGNVANMTSGRMLNYVNSIGNQLCVPPALMLAEMQREAPVSFSWTDTEFDFFSQVGWENNIDINDPRLARGYCYNNNAGAAGITQFIQSTFDAYKSKIVPITNHTSPDRCNAEDAIVALALKVKADSGTNSTNCTNWDQATVDKVAGNYCGDHCTGPCYQPNPPQDVIDACSAQCGLNYCGGVYQFYQGYQAGLVCTATGGPGHPEIVAADEALPVCTYYPNLCGVMVEDALRNAGFQPMISANGSASGLLNAAAPMGYQVFQLPGGPIDIHPHDLGQIPYNQVPQLPQPGDVAVWNGNTAASIDGHTGIVVDVKTVSGVTTVFVHSNLDCPTGNTYTGNRDTAFIVKNGNLVSSQLSSSVYQLLGFARVTDKVKK